VRRAGRWVAPLIGLVVFFGAWELLVRVFDVRTFVLLRPSTIFSELLHNPGFYWRNGFFWVKLGLFGLIFALELAPMITFIRVRTALARGAALPEFPLGAYRRMNSGEVALVVAIVFVAAFMARGAWLF